MAIKKSFDFKNKGEITIPREVIHAQDLYGMLGFSQGTGIESGCTITIGATNRIDIASGNIFLNGINISFTADTVTLNDSGMNSGEHRWVTIYITGAGAIGSTVGTAVTTLLLPVKPTDIINFVICSILKTHGNDIVDVDVMSSIIDFANSTVITNSDISDAGSGSIITSSERGALHSIFVPGVVTAHTDVTDVGSGIIISDAERTALHSVFVPGVITAHTDITDAGSGIIISGAERTALHPEVTTLTHTSLTGKNSETNIKHLTDTQVSALHSIVTAGNLNHNDLSNLNAGTVYEHISATQVSALHNIFVPSTAVTNHSDISNAGSGSIITTGERTALHTKYALTEDLISNEITQLKNINSTTISTAQWGYVGLLNQNLRVTDDVDFESVETKSLILQNLGWKVTIVPEFGSADRSYQLANHGGSTNIALWNSSTTTGSANVIVSSNADGAIRQTTSSLRFKTDLKPLTHDSSKFYAIKPVDYESISDKKRFYGLIAEEVAELFPIVAIYEQGKDGKETSAIQNYDTRSIIAIHIEETHRLNDRITKLENDILRGACTYHRG